jgi:hypothetical protein
MNRLFLSAVLFLCGIFLSPLFAQTVSKGIMDADRSDYSNELSLVNPDDEEWTYYLDEEKKVYYIDFESISVNLTDIIIKDSQGKVVYEDEVFELPVDTIYEIDMNQFAGGRYRIEIKSYTNTTVKEVTLR